uniref:Uncharacterized protein n=1 Tax=Candidatus Kentrum sp. LFY TaxID=2126342 RepID=A0A450UZ11_9GAMM|nr:MAG: hypothetical protein BECKLFY1418B_GA0070995_11087 [Candidatus Kentron sp. LFY]
MLREAPGDNSQKALRAYRKRLNKARVPLNPSEFLFSTLSWEKRLDWGLKFSDRRFQRGDNDGEMSDQKQELVPTVWSKKISDSLKNSKLAIPLSQLIRKFHYYFRFRPLAGRQIANNSPTTDVVARTDAKAPKASAQANPPPKPQFVSALIIEAFNRNDPHLSFDIGQLRQFLGDLRVYRNLLDGDVVPRKPKEADSQPAVLPVVVFFKERLIDPSFSPAVLFFWGAVLLFLLLLLVPPVFHYLSDLARALVNRRYLTLQAEAEGFLEELGFRSSRETSAGPASRWFKLGQKRTLAARDFTLPGLTALSPFHRAGAQGI